MNDFEITLLVANVVAMLLIPRRWIPLPLLIGACYIGHNQTFELGPFHFSIVRTLIATGLVRVILRGERLAGPINSLDRVLVLWAAWMLIASLFHEDPSTALVNRLGLIYDACGIYFLVRAGCQSLDDVKGLCRFTAILLLPVAFEMIYEQWTASNLFYALGGVSLHPAIRRGHLRAQGPFAHSILAGSMGAVCLPLVVPLWLKYRKAALIGIGSCLVMIGASASSGPILSMMAALTALCMYRYRHRMQLVRWLLVLGYLALDVVMNDPAYYIVARIDFVGGSTGWFRARLIQSALEHISEWWLTGTDYTRHWMATGVYWSADQADITCHYLEMGVLGGLLLMLLFMAILAIGFSYVSQTLRQMPELTPQSRFMLWGLGSALFAHAVTFFSISYFDQSVVFFYLTLAAIGSVRSHMVFQAREEMMRKEPFQTVIRRHRRLPQIPCPSLRH